MCMFLKDIKQFHFRYIYYFLFYCLLTLCTRCSRRCLVAFTISIICSSLPRPVQKVEPTSMVSSTASIINNNRHRISHRHDEQTNDRWQHYLQPRWRRDHHHRWVKMPIIDRCGVHVDGDSFLPKREVDITIVSRRCHRYVWFWATGNYRGYN